MHKVVRPEVILTGIRKSSHVSASKKSYVGKLGESMIAPTVTSFMPWIETILPASWIAVRSPSTSGANRMCVAWDVERSTIADTKHCNCDPLPCYSNEKLRNFVGLKHMSLVSSFTIQ